MVALFKAFGRFFKMKVCTANPQKLTTYIGLKAIINQKEKRMNKLLQLVKTNRRKKRKLKREIYSLRKQLKRHQENNRLSAIKKFQAWFGQTFEDMLDMDKLCQILCDVSYDIETDGNHVISMMKGTQINIRF